MATADDLERSGDVQRMSFLKTILVSLLRIVAGVPIVSLVLGGLLFSSSARP